MRTGLRPGQFTLLIGILPLNPLSLFAQDAGLIRHFDYDQEAVSLLTDGPVARPGHVENAEPLNAQQIVDLVQEVVDMRRGV